MNPCTIESLEQRTMMAVTPLALDGGDSLASPTILGKVAGQYAITDSMQGAEQADYFQFSVSSKGSVNLSLTGMTSDLNLTVYDSTGKALNSPADAFSKTLNKGTYTVAVTRAPGAADSAYTLTLQADLNYQSVSIDGKTYTLGLVRSDGSSAPISNTRETWITMHGWLGSPKSVRLLSTAIDAASKRNQVLEVDWSGPAGDLNNLAAIGHVPEVGAWVAQRLKDWDIPGSIVNLAGHSMGGYLTDEVARRVSGGVDRIVALDPATPAWGGFDLSGTDFAAHSLFSLAMIGSNMSSPVSAYTADETIKLNVGKWSSSTAHTNVFLLFATMTANNNTLTADAISKPFALSKLHAEHRGFTKNAFEGEYEAVLTGKAVDWRVNPTVLDYKSLRTGKLIRVLVA